MPPEALAGFLLAFALGELWSTFVVSVDCYSAEEAGASSNPGLTSSLDSVALGFLGILQILCLVYSMTPLHRLHILTLLPSSNFLLPTRDGLLQFGQINTTFDT